MADSLIGRRGADGRGLKVGATASRLVVSVFCFLPSAFCYAEELPDPTRPPASVAAPAAAVGAETAPSGLRSIIISKSRRAAIIDGETVELGGKHGGAKLIEVNEGSVVLQGAQGRQVLTLFPDVKMIRAAPPTKKEMETDPKVKATPQSQKNKVRPRRGAAQTYDAGANSFARRPSGRMNSPLPASNASKTQPAGAEGSGQPANQTAQEERK